MICSSSSSPEFQTGHTADLTGSGHTRSTTSVADGRDTFAEYFRRLAREYAGKGIEFRWVVQECMPLIQGPDPN
jgi:hypothetical protein